MNSLFKEKYLDISEKLSEDGFVVVNFLIESELNKLESIYIKNKTEINESMFNGIHMTTWIKNNNLKLSIKDNIESVIKNACNRIFIEYRMLNTIFIIKNQNKTSNFPLHQDWSFVDERKHEALNIWIALQDTNLENGGLFVIKGSHLLGNHIRGAGRLTTDYMKYNKILKKYTTPINLKRGQAVIFYYSTIHGSTANQKKSPRIITATTIIPKYVPLTINYFNEKDRSLMQFDVKDDFIYKYNDIRGESIMKQPEGILINTIENYIPEEIDLIKLRKTINIKSSSLLDKLKRIFFNLFLSIGLIFLVNHHMCVF